uniref:Uncharacterized protein n=1 Tax=Anguilla anguilla TaxID=7936 RepID=A0A0E9QWL7_ANGAN
MMLSGTHTTVVSLPVLEAINNSLKCSY